MIAYWENMLIQEIKVVLKKEIISWMEQTHDLLPVDLHYE